MVLWRAKDPEAAVRELADILGLDHDATELLQELAAAIRDRAFEDGKAKDEGRDEAYEEARAEADESAARRLNRRLQRIEEAIAALTKMHVGGGGAT
jgi:hypothetical protein